MKQVLAGKSPRARAIELVTGTKLKDVALRKDLYGKDAAALQAAHDPMLDVARMIDAPGTGSAKGARNAGGSKAAGLCRNCEGALRR